MKEIRRKLHKISIFVTEIIKLAISHCNRDYGCRGDRRTVSNISLITMMDRWQASFTFAFRPLVKCIIAIVTGVSSFSNAYKCTAI